MIVFKDIPGYKGLYQINNVGDVKSLERKITYPKGFTITVHEKILKHLDRGEYDAVRLAINQKDKMVNIHRLMAEVFLPNPNNYPCVNHKDENKRNNYIHINDDGTVNEELSNLEWCTKQYNLTYKGIRKKAAEKLSKPVLQFTKDGKFIGEWPSVHSIEKEMGWSAGHILYCCEGRKNYKTRYGYIWKFKNP